MRASRFLAWLGAAAVCGIAVFGVLVWRAVDVIEVSPAEAARHFEAARRPFGTGAALVARQADGGLIRTTTSPPAEPGEVAYILVMSYRVAGSRLTRAEIPFWFFRLKAPAAQFVVRDTGLDLSSLGLTAHDLQRAGPALVLDESDAAGNRLMVWTSRGTEPFSTVPR